MKRLATFLPTFVGAAAALILTGAVIQVATARSALYLFGATLLGALGIVVIRWRRSRHFHLRMADALLGAGDEEVDQNRDPLLPPPASRQEGGTNRAILRNRAIVRERRAGRVAGRRRTDPVIHLVGYPRH